MISVLLASLLAADPGADRKHAIWIAPASTVFYYFAQPPRYFLDKPVVWGAGGQLAVSPQLSPTLDVSFIPIASTSDDNTSSPAWLFTASVGLLFKLWGPEQLKGLFVQPRVGFATGRAWGPRCGFGCNATVELVEAMGVVDVGFQWRFWRLYLAAVLGVGAGVCVGCGEQNAHRTVTRGTRGRPNVSQFAWGVDLDFLRIGLAL